MIIDTSASNLIRIKTLKAVAERATSFWYLTCNRSDSTAAERKAARAANKQAWLDYYNSLNS